MTRTHAAQFRARLQVAVLAFIALVAGGCAARPSVRELAQRAADEQAILAASVEPAIRDMLREWEPWGKWYSGKPIVTDEDEIPIRYPFVKTGEQPFRPATEKELERAKAMPSLYGTVRIDGVPMRPANITTLEGPSYEIQAFERTYTYEFDRVDRVNRTANPAYPFEAVIRVKVIRFERSTSKERITLEPDPPEGYRPLTDTEMAHWKKVGRHLGFWGVCNQMHTPRHGMPSHVRNLDLPLPGRYHSELDPTGRYYWSVGHDAEHPPPPSVQQVVERHLKEWNEALTFERETIERVTLSYSLKENRWVARRAEHPKFTDMVED